MKHITIAGAGITGLTLGYLLQKKGYKVTIYEKSDRPGGWIRTIQHENYLFELGPRTVRPAPQTLELIKELGLEKELLYAPPQNKYIYKGHKLEKVNFPFLLKNGLLEAALRYPLTRKKNEETISTYCNRRLGKTFTRNIVDPVIQGIYAGDITKLSMQACFPKRPKTKGLISFKHGMETLTRTLSERLDIVTNCVSEADISTIPAPMPRQSITTVNLGFPTHCNPYRGFGFLIPSWLNSPILGCTFDSSIFPSQSPGTRLCVMLRGLHSDPDATTLALQTLQILSIYEQPTIHISHAENAIPQYYLGSTFNGISVNDRIASARAISELISK